MRPRSILVAIILALTAPLPTAVAHEGENHEPARLNVTAGAFHLHLVPLQKGFEVHVHDVAKHLPVDLTSARTRATLLAGGKTTAVPLTVKGKGILAGAATLPPRWAMLVTLTVAGQKVTTARFSSGEKKANAQ